MGCIEIWNLFVLILPSQWILKLVVYLQANQKQDEERIAEEKVYVDKFHLFEKPSLFWSNGIQDLMILLNFEFVSFPIPKMSVE
jgi:hypothetical protein